MEQERDRRSQRRMRIAVWLSVIALLVGAGTVLRSLRVGSLRSPELAYRAAWHTKHVEGRAAGIAAFRAIRHEFPDSPEALTAGLQEALFLMQEARHADDPMPHLHKAEEACRWVIANAADGSRPERSAALQLTDIKQLSEDADGALAFLLHYRDTTPGRSRDFGVACYVIAAYVEAEQPMEALAEFEDLTALTPEEGFAAYLWPLGSAIEAHEQLGEGDAIPRFLADLEARHSGLPLGDAAHIVAAERREDVDELIRLLDNPEFVSRVASSLGHLGHRAQAAIPKLRAMARSDDQTARLAAESALREIEGGEPLDGP